MGDMNAHQYCRNGLKSSWSYPTLVFLVLELACGGLNAQNTGSIGDKKVEADSRWALEIANGELRKLDGKTIPATLVNVIDYLRNIYPANLVMAPGIDQIKIPNLKLSLFQWEE